MVNNMINLTIDNSKLKIKKWSPQLLSQAKTLPAEIYLSPEIYQLEQRYVFGKAWYYAGHTSQLSEPGSFFTVEIADQPLVILRNKEGHLSGFFNVCPHRAGPIAEESGKCSLLVCRYHGWSFDLNGKLRNAPEMESCGEFDSVDHALTPIQVETWGPFIFVNLDPTAKPLAAAIGEIPKLFERYQFSHLARIHSVDYWTEVNWKVFNEITVESYHEAVLHPSTLAQYYHCAKTTGEIRHGCYLQHAPLLLKENFTSELKKGLYIETLNEVEQKSFNMVCLFPNFTLVMGPDCCITFLVDPQGVSKTRVRVDWLVPDTEQAKSPAHVESLVQFFDDLMQEDLRLMPLIQKRIGSLGYHQGQLCPKREMGVHLFQELLMQHLSNQML
jgi:phenylpropionate dioxygenase-like ring-hydroxylating dioxygenase large terminal subunit